MPHWVRLFLCLLLGGGLALGCAESESGGALGDWTRNPESLRLTEELRVSETKNYFFGQVHGLAVAPDGRMLVAEWDPMHIKVLRPDGTLIDSLGGEGQGPGEFQHIGHIRVARGDSLYVSDPMAGDLTVFDLSAPFTVERTVSSPRERVSEIRVMGDRLAGEFGEIPIPGADGPPPPQVWRLMDETGAAGDTLVVTPRRRMKFIEIEGGGVMSQVPFGRRSHVAVGPDGALHHGWTDSLHVAAVDASGSSRVVASIPTEPVPVRDAERDSALADIDRPALRSKLRDFVPDTKPAFSALVVADDGALWVERPAENVRAPTTTWWRLEPASKTIQEVRLPQEVMLHAVQSGKAYGVTETGAGAPVVVRYEIEHVR